MTEPSWRKPAGTFAIIALIIFWAWAVVTLIGVIDHWPILLQMPVYLIAGLIWVFPLRPLIRWMESGHFRR